MRDGTEDRQVRAAARSTAVRWSPAAPSAPLVRVDQVLTASRVELIRIWRALHGHAPPRSISQPLLRRILAFDLQLRDSGGWPAGLEERIARAGRPASRVASAPPPLAGGRLLRDWNGVTHVVEVNSQGYRWQGKDWRSLSAIARAITGAHWSGPRFFGLGDDAAAKKRGKTAKRMAKVSSAARPASAIGQPPVQSSTARRGRGEA